MTATETLLPVSIVIPTYGREQVLLDSVQSLLDLDQKAAEIIIVDQTRVHQPNTRDQLRRWENQGIIRHITLPAPSIPHAMNTGLRNASFSIVLFLDDDIRAHAHLVSAHYQAHNEAGQIVAGRVIQPWDNQQKLIDDGHQFNSELEKPVTHFMGGNFSIDRHKAIASGGFDENFIGVAYRFEKEFADRWQHDGHGIMFVPGATIDHLKQTTGGTREYGEHLTTIKPHHAVGAYYYFLVSPKVDRRFKEILNRLIRSITTRHHLMHPWYIPVTVIGELRGLFKAKKLANAGPRYIQVDKAIS